VFVYPNQRLLLAAGIFGLLAIVVLSYLSIRLGKLDLFAAPGYTIYAIFDDITGLKNA